MNAIVQRYDRDAADYERYWAPVLQSTARRLLDYVDDFVHFVERRDGRVRILEVGVGTGALLRGALEHWPAAEFIAADAAPAMVELARSRLADGGYEAAGRVRFLNAPAEALSLPDASVDLVISTFVLQLVPDRITALREAHRVLAPSGMVAYLTWLDRAARGPFLPAQDFDEAVYDLEIDEPETPEEPHAGDVHSGRTAASELRRAGFVKASAREEVLEYDWSADSYLEYKLDYDERSLVELLDAEQSARLERNARERLARLKPHDFRWHAPVVFARAEKPRSS
ncbi:MAG TPA: class I SAM-dependent methyltransferase [Candidatus Limnocylindrales bacterium]